MDLSVPLSFHLKQQKSGTLLKKGQTQHGFRLSIWFPFKTTKRRLPSNRKGQPLHGFQFSFWFPLETTEKGHPPTKRIPSRPQKGGYPPKKRDRPYMDFSVPFGFHLKQQRKKTNKQKRAPSKNRDRPKSIQAALLLQGSFKHTFCPFETWLFPR